MSSPRVIAGRYRLERTLGQGGMGTVWHAVDDRIGGTVAVKILESQLARNKDSLARFQREVKAAALLRSPHVVQVFDHGIDEGDPYLVMELLEGESLAERLHRETRLSPQDTARIVTHVARAMTRAHEAGIVHRDLKPANIFLVRNDDETVAKVLDFGIAKPTLGEAAADVHTQTGAMLGSPYYMSPEQAAGSKSIDFRSDLWSLAVIAFECLTGRKTFEEPTIGALVLAICTRPAPVPSEVADVPDGFDAWFARGVAREPGARFESMREMAAELRRVCGLPEGPVSADAISTPKKTPAQEEIESAPTLDAGPVSSGLGLVTTTGPVSSVAPPPPSTPATPATQSPPSRPALGRRAIIAIGALAATGAIALAIKARSASDARPLESSSATPLAASSLPPMPAVSSSAQTSTAPSATASATASVPAAIAAPAPVAAPSAKTVKRVPSSVPAGPAPPASTSTSPPAPTASHERNLGI